MNTLKIGVLSDTHLAGPTDLFTKQVSLCFSDVSMIIHAGDLTDMSVLAAFGDREIHAVHGNMCRQSAWSMLPKKKVIQAGAFKIGIIHNTGFSYNFEDQLVNEFDEAVDCIVYGHTHIPTCHTVGPLLYLNPGSFMPTGRHGSPGAYAILEAGNQLHGNIFEVPRL
ncbi:MAG: YfcE family phosphodiesterase [Desulfobulbaceae bacterium]|nr:YfcE family phosphodiesterase [Desulfobulbaceae bacterium]MCK5404251.1 YfcE family phosphodiesterase [Desulfobulbaceae bacterium]